MDDNAKLPAGEILEAIKQRISQPYLEPQFAVYTLGELEAVLRELHWLYASAVSRLDDYTKSLGQDYSADLRISREFRENHRPFELPNEAAEIIQRWQRFDRDFGLELPEPVPTAI